MGVTLTLILRGKLGKPAGVEESQNYESLIGKKEELKDRVRSSIWGSWLILSF